MFTSEINSTVDTVRKFLRTEIETMGLTVITLSECLQILAGTSTKFDLPRVCLRDWQDRVLGYRLPPTNNNQVKTLVNCLATEFGSKCMRYNAELVRYQNVETEYLMQIIDGLVRNIFGIVAYEFDEVSTSSSTSSGISVKSHWSDTKLGEDQDIYGLVFMKYGGLSTEKLVELAESKGIHIGNVKSKGSRQQKAKLRALVLDKIVDQVTQQEPDDCEIDNIEVEILLAIDLRKEVRGILPRSKYLGKHFDYLSKQKNYESYHDKLKSATSDKFQDFSRRRFSYNYNPLNRIHGFLITQDNGCAVYNTENPPSINQLVAICSSPFTDRVPPNKPFTVGSLLIGFYLVLVKHLKYDWSILEVANNCVGGEEEDGIDFYGSREYLKGKESQHSLFCFYERFGYREDARLFKDLKCFGIHPYPSMKLLVSDYSIECLREISFGKEWTNLPSNFCRTRITKDVSLLEKCNPSD